jgi:hypothetical protein
MLQQLLTAKQKTYFKHEEWRQRGLNPSDDQRQNEMRQVVDEFIDSCMSIVQNQGTINEANVGEILLNLEEGVFDDFDSEEREWIIGICWAISSDIGLDIKKIINYEDPNSPKGFGIGDILSNMGF